MINEDIWGYFIDGILP
ncbi:hypothetical protein V9T40_003264 [Parthenolecanium corni]|uniref:Uncharacterized protein n=1 Tax=Parthenolecanium corni TaxID=536013 RepID=A0AAN9TUZ9_9HEMI